MKAAPLSSSDETAVVLESCLFVNNSVGNNSELTENSVGGALAMRGTGATANIMSSNFTSNSAMGDGGSISCENGCQISIQNSMLTGNTAADGGGVYINVSSLHGLLFWFLLRNGRRCLAHNSRSGFMRLLELIETFQQCFLCFGPLRSQ